MISKTWAQDDPELQVMFDRVLQHIRRQRRQSKKGKICAYRGKYGAMCAVGCLIPDSVYTSDIEGMVVTGLPRAVLEAIGGTTPTRRDLLSLLQEAHDQAYLNADTTKWSIKVFEMRMSDIASRWGLDYKPVGV